MISVQLRTIGARQLLLALTAAMILPACFQPAGEDEVSSCAPLVGEPADMASLANILGVGRHSDGTIYLMDQLATGEFRAFASAGTTLNRQPIGMLGRATVGSGMWYVVTIKDAASPFTLKIDTSVMPMRMGVVRGPFADLDFVIGQKGDVLEVVTAQVLNGMTVLDLPRDVFVEYFAHLADGRQLVVVRPRYNWSYGQFRLFLGTADRMTERKVNSAQRASDGSSTTVSFVLDGVNAQATFPSAVETGAATIAAGSTMFTLTVEPAGTAPPTFSYLCL